MDDHRYHDWCPKLDVALQREMSRRTMLCVVGGSLTAAVVAGCGSSNDVTSAATTTSGGTTTTGGTTSTGGTTTGGTTGGSSATAVTPEGEIGPYFTDDSDTGYNRSNIVSNVDGTNTQVGVQLTLSLFVYDSEKSNAPVVGAQIAVAHGDSLRAGAGPGTHITFCLLRAEEEDRSDAEN